MEKKKKKNCFWCHCNRCYVSALYTAKIRWSDDNLYGYSSYNFIYLVNFYLCTMFVSIICAAYSLSSYRFIFQNNIPKLYTHGVNRWPSVVSLTAWPHRCKTFSGIWAKIPPNDFWILLWMKKNIIKQVLQKLKQMIANCVQVRSRQLKTYTVWRKHNERLGLFCFSVRFDFFTVAYCSLSSCWRWRSKSVVYSESSGNF